MANRHFLLAALAASVLSLPQAPASAGVTLEERSLVDTSRATPANGSYGGAGTRTLRTLVWTPEGACTAGGRCAPYPLLLMAHGMSGLPETFDAFARTMAEGGYVVAAPAFPLTNASAPGGSQSGFSDTMNQPDDLVFVASKLTSAAANPSDGLFERIATDSVTALGVSLGGATVEALAHTDCCDSIELEAAVLAGTYTGILQMFGGMLHSHGPTTLVLHGRDDELIPFSTVPNLLEVLPMPRFLVGIKEAEHDDYIDSQTEPATAERAAAELATLSFLDWKTRGEQSPFTTALDSLAGQGHTVVIEQCLAETGACAAACTEVSWSQLPGWPPDQHPARSLLKFKGLDRPGRNKLVAKGFFNPASGTNEVDPANDGVHVRLGVNGNVVYDVNVPAQPVCSSRDGWRTKTGAKRMWKYRNRSGTLGPLCAEGSAKGLASVVIKDLSSTSKGAFRYTVKVKRTTIGTMPAEPLNDIWLALVMSAQAELGVPSSAATSGRCSLDRISGDPIAGSPPKPFCSVSGPGPSPASVLCKGL